MTNDVTRFDAVVTGGGPSGLIAALALGQAGFSTALIAPDAMPDDQRTTALLAGSVESLTVIGVWDSIRPHAAPLKIMRIVDGTRRLVRAPAASFDSAEIGLSAFGYNIRNQHLVSALKSCLEITPAVTWLRDWTDEITPLPDQVAINTRSGRSLSGQILVAADGRNSPARQAAEIETREWHYNQSALVINLEHTEPHFDSSTEFHTETGPFTLVPLAKDLSSLVCVVTPETASQLSSMDDEDLALELEERASSVLGRFRVVGPCQVYPLSGMSAACFGRNRIALIGEAGHVFPPIGAQGLNLGIRDIMDLVTRMTSNHPDPGSENTLASFDQSRQRDVSTRSNAVHLLNRSLLTDFLPMQLGRSATMALASQVGPLRRFMMREGVAPGRGMQALFNKLTVRPF